MQNDLEKGNDHSIPQRGNRTRKIVQINKVVPSDPFLVAKQPLRRNKLLECDDQSAQGNIHVDEDNDDPWNEHQVERELLPEFTSGVRFRCFGCFLHLYPLSVRKGD